MENSEKLHLSEDKLETLKTCLLWTFIWGFAAHGFAYSNFLFNHDGLILAGSELYMLTLGRFGHVLYFFLRGSANIPWLCGILSNLYIALSLFLIANIFDIHKKIDICICSGILSTNVTFIIINATYSYFCDVYALSILFATLSFYIIVKRQSVKTIIFSSTLLMLAMGLHQISLPVWLVLAVIFTLQQNIKQKYLIKINSKNTFLSKHFDVIIFFFVVLLACILYKIGSSLSLKLTNTEYNKTWNYVEDATDFKSVNIPKLIYKTYKRFFKILISAPNYYSGEVIKKITI